MTDPMTEAADMAAKELENTRKRLLAIREGCDRGIAQIEVGECPPALLGLRATEFEEETLAVARSLVTVRVMSYVFGDRFMVEVRRVLGVRLGASFKHAYPVVTQDPRALRHTN